MTNPVSQARDDLSIPQYMFDTQAHLELLVKAWRGGIVWQIERAVAGAERHLDRIEERP